MLKTNTKSIFLYLVTTFFFVNPILAQDNLLIPKSIKDRSADKRDMAEQRTDRRCDHINERLEIKVKRYNSNREDYLEKYKNLRLRIAAWANKLKDDGYNVEDLESSLATLDTKIKAVATLHEEFIIKLKDIKNYQCGNSDGSYAQALSVSREALRAVRDGVSEVRKYYIEEVKPLVIALRNQVANDKQSDESKTD